MALLKSLSMLTHRNKATNPEAPLVVSTATALFPRSAIANDVDIATTPNAVESWDALIEGRMSIVGHALDETHASLFVSMQTPKRPMAPSIAHAPALKSILIGGAQKVVVLDCDISPATATCRFIAVLRAVGLAGTVRRVPLALPMIASSHAIGGAFCPPGYQAIPSPDAGRLELRMLRPETAFRPFLSSTEYEVLRAVIEGCSYEEIANSRDRSPRTIANQLRSITAKLGVCGRFQYINLAVRISGGVSRRDDERVGRGACRRPHAPASRCGEAN